MQMTTAISIEDVRREVTILRALSGHKHLIRFYDACEDENNVYIVMEYVSNFLIFSDNENNTILSVSCFVEYIDCVKVVNYSIGYCQGKTKSY